MHDIGFAKHDHTACVSSAMDTVESYCSENKVQLTPARRRVLEILLEHHKAMGAYDILALLSAEGLGSQPPVVYRALDFLQDMGLAHKIESLNAYVACGHTNHAHSAVFIICDECGAAEELHAVATSEALAARSTSIDSRRPLPRTSMRSRSTWTDAPIGSRTRSAKCASPWSESLPSPGIATRPPTIDAAASG